MKKAAIWREAIRNILTGTTRTAAYALILSAIVLSLTAAELSTVRALTDAAADFQDSGASIVTLQADGRVDGSSCEALNSIAGVTAAGALRTRESGLTAAALPSSAIPVMEITRTFPDVLRANVTGGPGVILSDQAASTLDLNVGDRLITRDSSTQVAGIYPYPNDGRRSGYGYAALVPVSSSAPFDECWVDVWPTSKEIPALLQTVVLPASEESAPAQLTQLNTSRGTTFDGKARFETRITRFAAPAGFIISIALGYVAIRARRIQLASALHAGASKRALTKMVSLELLSWILPTGLLAGSLAFLYIANGPAGDLVPTLTLSGSIAGLALLGPFLGAYAALVSVSEKHLFRYFKDR